MAKPLILDKLIEGTGLFASLAFTSAGSREDRMASCSAFSAATVSVIANASKASRMLRSGSLPMLLRAAAASSLAAAMPPGPAPMIATQLSLVGSTASIASRSRA